MRATRPGSGGTVGEAMTGEVVVLEADAPVDVAVRRLEHTRCRGLPSSTMDAWLAW